MTLEQLVPSLDLCQQLQAAGFPQDTALVWADNLQYAPDVRSAEPPVLMTRESAETIKELCKRQIEVGMEQFAVRCAAPTAGELEEWLLSLDAKEVAEKMGARTLAENGDRGCMRIEQVRVDFKGTVAYVVQLHRPLEVGAQGKGLVDALAALVLEVAGALECRFY